MEPLEILVIALILIGITIDFIIHKTKYIFKRLLFYSFIVYLLNVVSVTLPPFLFPPDPSVARVSIQLIPLYFISDWLIMFQQGGVDWFFLNSVKLSFYNFIMLGPLGVYLFLLFNVQSFKKAVLFLFLTSLLIEVSQLVLSYFGFIFPRSFDVDDLMLNTMGGWLAFILTKFIVRIYKKLKNKDNTNIISSNE